MKLSHTPRVASALVAAPVVAALALPWTALPAQQPTSAALVNAADALIESVAPSQDHPKHAAEKLLTAFTAIRGHRLATQLIRELDGRLQRIADPREAWKRLQQIPEDGIDGEARHGLDIVRLGVLSDLGRRAEIPRVFSGYANAALVFGPYGDAGDYHTSVAFPFDTGSPELGGRYGPVRARIARRKPTQFRIRLADPLRLRAGCHYALYQFHSEKEAPGYLRIYVNGSFVVKVNGVERGRVEVGGGLRTPPHFVPVVFRAGHNQVQVKCGDNRTETIGLRIVDTAGNPLDGIREHDPKDGLLPFAVETPKTSLPSPWQHHEDLLAPILPGLSPKDRDTVRLALAYTTRSLDRATTILWEMVQSPPKSPRLRLALAKLLPRLAILPPAERSARARSLIEEVGDQLGDHYTLFEAQIGLLESDGQLEEAVRRLIARDQKGLVGPRTLNLWGRMSRELGDWTTYRKTQNRWLKTYPYHPEPRISAIRFRRDSGDIPGMLQLAREGRRQHPGQDVFLQPIHVAAATRGDLKTAHAAARALVANTPPLGSYDLLVLQESIERSAGNTKASLDLTQRLAAHPEVSLTDLENYARRLLEYGRTDAAQRISRRILKEAPDRFETRRLLAQLENRLPFPDLEPYRVTDAEQLIADFQPGDQEASASSTLLLDQILIEVLTDGSHVQETHTIRRINDLAGVQKFEEAEEAASADRILTLRTIDVDGKSYLPSRVDDTFSMPRLKPGVFIEQAFRSDYGAARPRPTRITEFSFQSQSEPFVRSELVLITPPGYEIPIHTRGAIGKPKIIELPNGKTVRIYRRDRVPRLPTEDHAPPVEGLVPRVGVGEPGEDASLARDHWVSASYNVRHSPVIAAATKKLIENVEGDAARARAIHRFAQDEIASARSSVPSHALLQGKGSRFWLELAMLQAAGVPFRHGLSVREKRNPGVGSQPLFPGDATFEVPCALVEPRDAESFWLFAGSPRYLPAGLISVSRLGAQVLLIEPNGSQAKRQRLPGKNERIDEALVGRGQLNLVADGTSALTLTVTLPSVQGYGLAEYLRTQTNRNQKRFLQRFLGQLVPGWTPSGDVTVLSSKHEPLQFQGRFERRGVAQGSGATRLLSLPIGATRWSALYSGRSQRQLPIQLDRHLAFDWEVTIDTGETYRIDKVPEATRIDSAMTRLSQSFTKTANGAIVRRRIEIRPGGIPASEAPKWRQTMAAMDAAEAARLTLEKKE